METSPKSYETMIYGSETVEDIRKIVLGIIQTLPRGIQALYTALFFLIPGGKKFDIESKKDPLFNEVAEEIDRFMYGLKGIIEGEIYYENMEPREASDEEKEKCREVLRELEKFKEIFLEKMSALYEDDKKQRAMGKFTGEQNHRIVDETSKQIALLYLPWRCSGQ